MVAAATRPAMMVALAPLLPLPLPPAERWSLFDCPPFGIWRHLERAVAARCRAEGRQLATSVPTVIVVHVTKSHRCKLPLESRIRRARRSAAPGTSYPSRRPSRGAATRVGPHRIATADGTLQIAGLNSGGDCCGYGDVDQHVRVSRATNCKEWIDAMHTIAGMRGWHRCAAIAQTRRAVEIRQPRQQQPHVARWRRPRPCHRLPCACRAVAAPA